MFSKTFLVFGSTSLLLAYALVPSAALGQAFSLSITEQWTTNTTLLAAVQNGNEARGVGYDGTNFIVAVGDSGTGTRSLSAIDPANGAVLGTLSLTVTDPYDADNDSFTTDTFTFASSVGPYDIATAVDGSMYVCAFPSAAAGRVIARIEDFTLGASPRAVAVPVDLAGTTAIDLRALSVAGSGTGTLIYAPTANTGTTSPFRVYSTSNGNSFTSAELVDLATDPRSVHAIIAKPTNTGADGDVIWCSVSGGAIERWVRTGGTWVRDIAFGTAGAPNSASAGDSISVVGGDYASIGGEDIVIVMRGTSTSNERNRVYFLNGDNGAVLTTYQVGLNGVETSGGNGDVSVVETSATTGEIAFVSPDRHRYGLLSYSTVAATEVTAGAIVINEVGTLETGTDDAEFIELYGTPGLDLSDLEVAFVNAGSVATPSGNTYNSFSLSGQTMPGDGYFVLGSSLVPNVDLVVLPATNLIQNGDPDAVVIRSKSTGAILDSMSYFTNYSTTPGVPVNITLPNAIVEGGDGAGSGGDDTFNTQIGLATAIARIDTSVGRFPDGVDTNNNFFDFNPLWNGRSPGLSNATSSVAIPQTDDFATTDGVKLTFGYTFVAVQVHDISAATPVIAVASPDPVTSSSIASVKDNSGGGDEAILANILARDMSVLGDFYAGPISTVADGTEVGTFMALYSNGFQANANSASDITSPIGTYGDSYYGFWIDYVAGTVQAVSVLKSVPTNVGSPVAVSTGWSTLGVNTTNGEVRFTVNGELTASLSSQTARAGTVGIGYRETSTGSTGQVRNNFDNLRVLAPSADIDSSPTLNFGSTTTGNPVDIAVPIRNYGLSDLSISGVAAVGASTGYSIQGVVPTLVAAGLTANSMIIRFNPPSTGTFNETFVISSNDPDEAEYEISVTGNSGSSVSEWLILND
ncbi:MAG: hypothetical protein RLY93_01190 [Sumerlaeia bacterium]